MLNMQKRTATAADVADLLTASGLSACAVDAADAAKKLGKGFWVGLRQVGRRAVWVTFGRGCDSGKDFHDDEDESDRVISPPEGGGVGDRYFALAEVAIDEYQRVFKKFEIPIRHKTADGAIVDPAKPKKSKSEKVEKIDAGAYKRLRSSLLARINRAQSRVKVLNEILKKYTKPNSRYAAAARDEAIKIQHTVNEIDAELERIDAAYDAAQACKTSASTDCDVKRGRFRSEVVAKAPAKKTVVKRSKPPGKGEFALIAQDRLFRAMKKRDPKLKLPELEPLREGLENWAPDGPRQANAYHKAFSEMIRNVFYPAAYEGHDKGDEYAKRVAKAASPDMWAFYTGSSGGNVESMEAHYRKKPGNAPYDEGFPRVNPGRR